MNENPSNFRPRGSVSNSQHYLDASVRTATPAKLRLMLLERSVEVAKLLSQHWRDGQSPGPNEYSLSLLDLISELLSGVAGGESEAENKLCRQVADLYVFLLQHLIRAQEHDDASAVDEIRLVLEAETETWRAAVAQEATAKQAACSSHVPAPASQAASSYSGVGSGLNFSA